MKIYVASSWRNSEHQTLVKHLLYEGYDVYNFRNPRKGEPGFSWSEIDPLWEDWDEDEYIEALNNPIAEKGFKFDFDALKDADVCIMLLPCGRSASLEFGWACGVGKHTAILVRQCEPELMVKMTDRLFTTYQELDAWLRYVDSKI